MKKTILLGSTLFFNFQRKTGLWGSVIIGIHWVALGTTSAYRRETLGPLDLLLGSYWSFMGVALILSGILLFNQSSKYAPRFTLDENELLFKETIFKKSVRFVWNQIKRIEFGPYQLVISTDETDQTLYYSTQAETSKEIKSNIRKIAESKGIDVLGG